MATAGGCAVIVTGAVRGRSGLEQHVQRRVASVAELGAQVTPCDMLGMALDLVDHVLRSTTVR